MSVQIGCTTVTIAIPNHLLDQSKYTLEDVRAATAELQDKLWDHRVFGVQFAVERVD